MKGKSLGELAEVLGHKSYQMVKRYSHFSDNHIQSITSEMNNILFDDSVDKKDKDS